MCSQPPKNIDDSVLMDEALELINFLPRGLQSLGITGGEPTLFKEPLFEFLQSIISVKKNFTFLITLLHLVL